jgi:hypothetical protein
MTKQEILEGNRLIVNFMGIRPVYNSYTGTFQWGDGVFFRCGNILYEKTMDDIVAYVKYSTSWDWIMPVVNKIGKDFDADSLIESENFLCMRDNCIWGDPEAVFRSVIEMINELKA